MGIVSLLLYSALSFIPLQGLNLPSEQVKSLYQDGEGYIWVVTDDGLSRYDGYRSENYFSRSTLEHYGNNYLQCVLDLSPESLLVGTLGGLYQMDKFTGSVEKIDDPSLGDASVGRMIKDDRGKVWLSGNRGIFFKGPDERFFTRLSVANNPRALSDVIDFCFDAQGKLWTTSWMSGLHCYDLSCGKLYNYESGAFKSSYTLHLDGEGILWVGTWGGGLLRINPLHLSDEKPEYTFYTHSGGLIDDIVYGIAEDSSNRIWLSTRSGLGIFENGSFTNIYPGAEYGALPYSDSAAMLYTRDGVMLLGMQGRGVYKVVDKRPLDTLFDFTLIREEFLTGSVKSICGLGDEKFWLGLAGRGMVLYDAATKKAELYSSLEPFKGFPFSGLVDNILSVDGTVYFGSYESGLWKYTPSSEKCSIICAANSLLGSDSIRSLALSPSGKVIVGTRQGIYSVSQDDSVEVIDNSLNIQDLDVDADGNIYAALSYNGIVKITPSKQKKTYSEDQMSFNSILVGSSGVVYAGSSHDGLYVLSEEGESFEHLGELSFLNGESVCNLDQSPDGRIWLTTQSQVVSFQYSAGNFENLRIRNTSERFNPNSSAYVPENDSMAFGTVDGILTFPCGGDRSENDRTSPVLLTGIRGGNTLAKPRVGEIPEFSSKENDIELMFSLMDYSTSDTDIYRYRLCGSQDEHWHLLSGVDNTLRFNDLKSGKYRFEVCGSPHGDFSSSPVTVLEFQIKPDPWLSWWAIVLYILGFGGLIGSFCYIIARQARIKRAAEYEKFAAQKSEEVNQAKLRFFTDVSHEFLTPLSIILASIESLHPHSEQEKNVAEIMSSNAVRLTRLVQQVLEFRKVESGNLRLKVSKGDAADFVGHCVEAFKPLVRKKELTISYSADPTSIEAWFDVDKMDKIVYNLISNAVKYTPKGGTISVSVRLSSDGRLLVSCSNGGKLMGEKTIKGLFKRFYDGDYRKVTAIGTGIGLSLVKELVTLHKGEVKAESGEEFGNRFSFSIPIGKEDYSPEQREEEAPAALPLALSLNEAIVKEDYTVLCVDDSVDLLDLFSVILGKRFDVLTCQSGEEALELMSSRSVDVVVTDVMMPGMDGMALCSYIKEHIEFSHIPVIILSAKTDDASSIEGYNRGADGYMTKPCNFSVLGAMISSLMKKRQKQRSMLQNQMVFEVKSAEYTSIDKAFLEKVMKITDEHISDPNFTQGDFANEMCLSKTVLTEKLKSLTGYTPTALLINARLLSAYRTMKEQNGSLRVGELAYAVGFSDPKYFSKSFKAKFGKSPKEAMREFK